jgi:hypothetical protein
MQIQCACGCGDWLDSPDSKGRRRRFIYGHQRRGVILTLTTRQRMSAGQLRRWDRTTARRIHRGWIQVKRPGHPHAGAQGYILEHRIVMEAALGRYLEPHEIVHHIDQDRTNNDPANLMLLSSNAEHRRFHRRYWDHALR